MERIKGYIRHLGERFQALPASQRLLLLAVAGALGVTLGFLVVLQGPGEYGILFASLNPDDAGEIVAKLKEKKIPYRLENNGTAISVPKNQVYEMRLLLAGEGLPKGGGVGFEIFDRQNLGATPFVQQLNYQRALQGELARTIAGMPEVQEARVHVVTPKESVFLEDQKEPSASVALKLRPGRSLSPSQVEAVVNLVASAVPGLNPSRVTVVDLKGRILSKPQDRLGVQGLTTAQLSLQRQVEESYESKVQELFDKILGPNRSFVRVAAELDFQKIDLREETYTPNRELIRSEQKTYERRNTGAEGGNPEARFNLNQGTITPPPPGKGPPPLTAPAPPPTKAGTSGSERSSEIRNYEINRVVRQVIDSPGKIKRLSLAVVVDGIYQGKGNAFTPRSAEELRQFANLAKKAVGFTAERGDQFEISCAPLAVQVMEGSVALGQEEGWSRNLAFSWKTGLLVLVVLAALMFLLKRRRPQVQPQPLLQGPGPRELPAEKAQEALLPEGSPPMLTETGQPPPALPEAVDGQNKVNALIAAYPDRAVEVLRLWIHEKEGR